MERLIWHITDELSRDYTVHVVGPNNCGSRLPDGCSATEVKVSPVWWFIGASLVMSLVQAVRRRPRVVLAGSGLTAPIVWLAARLTGARCVAYLHGLDIDTKHRAYRLLWHPFLRHFDTIIANSRFTCNTARNAGITQDRLTILHPGVSLPDLSMARASRDAFRDRHDLGNVPLMLYVGRITKRKGLDVFIEQILPNIVRRHRTAKLVVLGDEPTMAVSRGDPVSGTIENALANCNLRSHVLFLGALAYDDPEISRAYFAADVHVFPVQNRPGDNEGFGMVAVEAAAHGLPTIAFSAGGVRDAVLEGVSGHLINPGDILGFSRAVSAELFDGVRPSRSARAFSESMEWRHFGEKLRSVLQKF